MSPIQAQQCGAEPPYFDACTIGDILERWSQLKPDETAYIFLEDGEQVETRVTYSELYIQSTSLAAEICSYSDKDAKALLVYPAGLEFIKGFFACIYAGIPAIPVSVAPRLKDLDLIRNILEDSGANLILTCSRLFEDLQKLDREYRLQARLGRQIKLIDTPLEYRERPAQRNFLLPRRSGQDIAFIQYTSGSTNIPKGVVLTHSNIIRNERLIAKAFGHDDQTIGMGWLPHYHDMGLIGNILQTMYIGRPCILMSPLHFVQRPVRWLQAISRYGATSSGGPNFAYELCAQKCKPEQLRDLDLSSWALAFVGAEMISTRTLRSFSEKFALCGFRGEHFYPCYGLAESTLFVTGRHERGHFRALRIKKDSIRKGHIKISQETNEQSIEVVGCGKTWEDHEVIIVDPETQRRCAPSVIGEIWVRGGSVAKGYWGKPELSEEVFSAVVMGESSRRTYLRTGDLGFLANSDLFITGRIKDIIVIRGHNYYPYDIEQTAGKADSHLIMMGAAAFSMEVNDSTELVIVQEVSRTGIRLMDYEMVAKSIRSLIVKNHGITPSMICLVKPHTIPRTSSGKIQRMKCRDMLLGKELTEVYRWTAHLISH